MNPETLNRIRDAAHAEIAGAPAPRPWWHGAVVLTGVNGAVAVACALALGASGFFGNPASAMVLVAVAVPVVAVIAVGAVFAVKPGARAGLMTALVLAVVAAAALIVGGSTATDAHPFLGRGIPCLRTELAIAVIPSAAAIAVLSRFAYNPLRMLVGALSGGATGLVVLHLHCPIGTAAHVAVFHVLPWMAAAGIAVLIRSRVGSRSFAP